MEMESMVAALRWRQTRKTGGARDDDALLDAALRLVSPVDPADESRATAPRLQDVARALNMPRERVVTEVLQLALALLPKETAEDRAPDADLRVLRVLHYALAALRGGGDRVVIAIPMQACNLLLAAIARALETTAGGTDQKGDRAEQCLLVQLRELVMFLFGMDADVEHGTTTAPSFHMYKPPTNVLTIFVQRVCKVAFARLPRASAAVQQELVAMLQALFVVLQDLLHSQTNKKKVYVLVAKTMLRELLSYRHAMRDCSHIQGMQDVQCVLDRTIVEVLLDTEHLREFDGAYGNLDMWISQTTSSIDEQSVPLARKKQRRKHDGEPNPKKLSSYQRHLFDELKGLMEDRTVSFALKRSVGSFMALMIGEFSKRIRKAANEKIEDTRADLKSSRKRVANVIATTSTTYSPFKFWAEMCGIAFNACEQQGGANAEDASNLLGCTFRSLFQTLCDSDIYRVTEDTQEQEQFQMMEKILASFVKSIRSPDLEIIPSVQEDACVVISNAVKCTPNLVNQSLISILEMAGASCGEPDAADRAMVDLLRSFQSMRLVDTFLHACFSVSDSNSIVKGLYLIFSSASVDQEMRRTFATLPPGQLELVWRLLVNQLVALRGSEDVAGKFPFVRLVMSVFLQELHIVPQNRVKICDLVVETHSILFSETVNTLRTSSKLSWLSKKAEREMFNIFGELLALYDGLMPSTRIATVDMVVDAMQPKLLLVMTKLLSSEDDAVQCSINGYVKIGIHFLRRMKVDKAAKSVAQLVVESVVSRQNWDAVAFYLPELMASVGAEYAATVYQALVESSVGITGKSDVGRCILQDAEFYEIAEFSERAPRALANVVASLSADSTASVAFFEYACTIPPAFVQPGQCGKLLSAVLALHISTVQAGSQQDAEDRITSWIAQHADAIVAATDVMGAADWASFVFTGTTKVKAILVQCAVKMHCCRLGGLDTILARLLGDRTSDSISMASDIVNAIAELRCNDRGTEEMLEEQEIACCETIKHFISENPTCLTSTESDTAFLLSSAVIKFAATVCQRDIAQRDQLMSSLKPRLGAILTSAMQAVVNNGDETACGGPWCLFEVVCGSYHVFRAEYSLQAFGAMLAAAMVCCGRSEDFPVCRPLASLLAHANREEFRLLILTVFQELSAPTPARVLAGLKTLRLVLESDKKISATRRQVLNEYQTRLVERLIQIISDALASRSPSSDRATLCVWSLRVFSLFYCKAELFAWKAEQLMQVFAGFRVLFATANDSAETLGFSTDQIHNVWTLSYSLLLRIVRHHFASLINALPLIINVLNVLLQELLAWSNSPDAARRLHSVEWSSNLARVYGYLKPYDTSIRKHIVYVLVAYLQGVTQGKLSVANQEQLRPGVFALLEICSPFEKEQLYASLDSAGKSLLKTIDTSFKLTYQFAGKV